jgi:hypothetical protein
MLMALPSNHILKLNFCTSATDFGGMGYGEGRCLGFARLQAVSMSWKGSAKGLAGAWSALGDGQRTNLALPLWRR